MSEELKARIAELEQKLCNLLDAERAANVLVSNLERQQAALVDAANAVLDSDGSRGTYDVVELAKSRTRLNAALAAVKGEKP